MSNRGIQCRTDASAGQDAFRSRMEQQCHQIRQYRQLMLRDCGRMLSPNEAALEWIERYAATFDRTGGATGE